MDKWCIPVSVYLMGIFCFVKGYGVASLSDTRVTSSGKSNTSRDDNSQEGVNCFRLGNITMELHVTIVNTANDQILPYSNNLRPSNVTLSAMDCSSKQSDVGFVFDDGELTMNMVFQTKITNQMQAWSLINLDIKFKGNDTGFGEDKLHKKRSQAQKSGFLMFHSPINQTYVCNTKHNVLVHSNHAQAALVFSQIRMHPFSNVAKTVYTCPQDANTNSTMTRHAEVIVPVILAASLAVVVLLLVIGYCVHRNGNNLGYLNMG